MKKQVVRKLRRVAAKSAVKSVPSKPMKTGLSKSDPDYYRQIGIISAEKRKKSGTITHEQLAAWARKSHENRTDYSRGGYRKEARLAKELKEATDQ